MDSIDNITIEIWWQKLHQNQILQSIFLSWMLLAAGVVADWRMSMDLLG